MPLKLDTGVSPPALLFEGIVTIEETDQLLETLQEHPDLCADLAGCEHLHTAPLQALKMLKVPIKALPDDPFWKLCFAAIPLTDAGPLTVDPDNEKESDTL